MQNISQRLVGMFVLPMAMSFTERRPGSNQSRTSPQLTRSFIPKGYLVDFYEGTRG
jgi:hypothetical protein